MFISLFVQSSVLWINYFLHDFVSLGRGVFNYPWQILWTLRNESVIPLLPWFPILPKHFIDMNYLRSNPIFLILFLFPMEHQMVWFCFLSVHFQKLKKKISTAPALQTHNFRSNYRFWLKNFCLWWLKTLPSHIYGGGPCSLRWPSVNLCSDPTKLTVWSLNRKPELYNPGSIKPKKKKYIFLGFFPEFLKLPKLHFQT